MQPSERLPLSADREKQDIIIELLAIGCSTRAAARCCLLHPDALERFIDTNPDFQARLGQAKANHESQMLAYIREAAKTNPRAAAWLRDHTRPAPNS